MTCKYAEAHNYDMIWCNAIRQWQNATAKSCKCYELYIPENKEEEI